MRQARGLQCIDAAFERSRQRSETVVFSIFVTNPRRRRRSTFLAEGRAWPSSKPQSVVTSASFVRHGHTTHRVRPNRMRRCRGTGVFPMLQQLYGISGLTDDLPVMAIATSDMMSSRRQCSRLTGRHPVLPLCCGGL